MSLEMAPFDQSHARSYSFSIVTIATSCIVSEIKRDIGEKSRFSYPFLLPTGESGCECFHAVFFTTKPDPLRITRCK